MFTTIETYSPAACDTRFMPAGSLVRVWNQGIHTDIALAGRSLR